MPWSPSTVFSPFLCRLASKLLCISLPTTLCGPSSERAAPPHGETSQSTALSATASTAPSSSLVFFLFLRVRRPAFNPPPEGMRAVERRVFAEPPTRGRRRDGRERRRGRYPSFPQLRRLRLLLLPFCCRCLLSLAVGLSFSSSHQGNEDFAGPVLRSTSSFLSFLPWPCAIQGRKRNLQGFFFLHVSLSLSGQTRMHSFDIGSCLYTQRERKKGKESDSLNERTAAGNFSLSLSLSVCLFLCVLESF